MKTKIENINKWRNEQIEKIKKRKHENTSGERKKNEEKTNKKCNGLANMSFLILLNLME